MTDLIRPAREATEPVPGALVEAVHGAMKALLRQVEPVLDEEGISMGHFWSLHLVSSLGPLSLSSVARGLSQSPPTVCANVDHLVRTGLVARRRSERDRRTVELTLTPAGRRVEARVWRAIAKVAQTAVRDLPASDVRAATRVFETIRTELEPSPRAVSA